MGFPVGYSEMVLPKIFLHFFSFLSLVRKLISIIFRVIGLPDFFEPDPVSWSDPSPISPITKQDSDFAILAGEILPVVRFSELNRPESECCAVCLCDFEKEDEIRRLRNCQHIYHRGCLDRWMMDYNQMTCPLCRTSIITDDLHLAFNQRMWSSESTPLISDSSYDL